MCTRTIYCTNIDKKVVSHIPSFSSNASVINNLSGIIFSDRFRLLKLMSSSSSNQFAGRCVVSLMQHAI